MKSTLQIIDEKNQLKRQASEIIDQCKKEIREMTEDEAKNIDEIKEKIDALNEELKEMERSLMGDEEDENEAVEKEDDDCKEEKNNKRNITNNNQKTMEFRLLSAINQIANSQNLDAASKAVVAQGVEEMRKAGVSYNGQIQIPVSEMRNVTVTSTDGATVSTEVASIIEPLRAKNVLIEAGAKFLTNLNGNVKVPVMNGSNVTWEGEITEAKDGGASFTSVELSPKRLTAYVDVSKQFLVQTSQDAEVMLRNDLINAINSKLESTILGSGAGSATEPKGIFNIASGETATTITDFRGICELEASVEDANVLGECKYVISNKAKASLRNMAKSAKSTELVMQNGTVDGTVVYNTSNVVGRNIAYGDWSQMAIGQWGAIDLTVDPFTLAKDGQIRIVVNAYFDAKVLRPEAIAVATV